MPLYDFTCDTCSAAFEAIIGYDAPNPLCTCGAPSRRQVCSPKIFSTIVPMYRGSQKLKAGTAHKFVNRPAEKMSVSVPAKVGG